MITTTMLLLFAGLSPHATEAPPSAEQITFFEKSVRPLLVEQCLRCHGGQKQRGELRLDSRAALLSGGQSGPAVVPGKPGESLLIDAIHYRKLEMPPNKKLSAKEVDVLTRWVQMGAPWPAEAEASAPTTRKPGLQVTKDDRLFWSFQPVQKPRVPRHPGMLNPLDGFVLEKLHEKGLSLSPRADRRTLLRRLTFDLTGLPPTPEEMQAFLADSHPDAYERVVDRLLASPHYGERWGRHWLDVMRFAQTNGYERDDEKPNAWRYRDYVIRALNADVPYDLFVRSHVAGDEMDVVTDDTLTATGFFRLGVWDDEPDDKKQAEFDELDDMLSTLGSGFLGLTIGCARCHDHKFDPIPQEDYYSLLSFLRGIKPYAKPDANANKVILADLKAGGQSLAVHEQGTMAPPTKVLLRGNAATPAKTVEPRFPRVLCSTDEHAVPKLAANGHAGKSTGRRRVLADWMVARQNPLTARVVVNRMWHHHFGRGIVATPSDFGHTGVRPTHPQLLDWLAAELMEGGWTLKRLHRLIVTSATYQQSSASQDHERAEALRVDPGNTLLWRQNLRRLEAESLRDSMLAVSGHLNRTMGGRGIFPTLPAEVLATQSVPGRGWDRSSEQEQTRRSVYIFVKRTLGVPMLDTFDFASPDTPTAVRATTTIAPQALLLLNSPFMEQQSLALADRLLRECKGDPSLVPTRMYQLALSRTPTAREADIARAYWQRERDSLGANPEAERLALARLAKIVLNLNEMAYVD